MQSKFATRKLNIANHQSDANYDVVNYIIHNTKVLKSGLCDYNDAYILVRANITDVAYHATQAAFRNCLPFTKCVTKVYRRTIEDAGDLDL